MVGGYVPQAIKPGRNYEGKTTKYVILASITAACAGCMFGYDIGVSGGVTSMDDFLKEFFPAVYENRLNNKNNYCSYNNQGLQAFTSSLYLAGMISSMLASQTTRKYGRRASILIGGGFFLMGAVLNAAAVNIEMLIIGRLLLGTGIGFANQAVPLFLSEMAPVHLRGALTTMFQWVITISILIANLVNYGTGKLTPWGWRISLGLAAVPGVFVIVGFLCLPETPHSLVERGRLEKGREILEKIRGTKNVDDEFEDIKEASDLSSAVKHPFRNILTSKYFPQLFVGIMVPAFAQMTGINSIMFYAPVLFKTIGFGSNAALFSAVIVGGVNVLATLVAIGLVDRWGRKKLLFQAGCQMFVTLVAIGVILEYNLGLHGQLPKTLGFVVVGLICIYVAAFAWSWGPVSWVIAGEIFPLEVRPAGQSISVATQFIFIFAIGQSLLTMLCVFEYGLFLFFAGWVVIMTICVIFLPETKGVPIEEISHLFREHWIWKRVINYDKIYGPYVDPVKANTV